MSDAVAERRSDTLIYLLFVFAALLGSAWGAQAAATSDNPFKAGDRIRVASGPAPVKVGDQVLTTVEAGREFVVLKVRGSWVQVTLEQGGSKVTGWIARRFLAPAAATLAELPRMTARGPQPDQVFSGSAEEVTLLLDLGQPLPEDARFLVVFSTNKDWVTCPVKELFERCAIEIYCVCTDRRRGDGPELPIPLKKEVVQELRRCGRGLRTYPEGRSFFWRAFLLTPGSDFKPDQPAVRPSDRQQELRMLSLDGKGVLEAQSMDTPSRFCVQSGSAGRTMDAVANLLSYLWWLILAGFFAVMGMVAHGDDEKEGCSVAEALLAMYPTFCLFFSPDWVESQDAVSRAGVSFCLQSPVAEASWGDFFTAGLSPGPVTFSTRYLLPALFCIVLLTVFTEGINALLAGGHRWRRWALGVAKFLGLLASGVLVLAAVSALLSWIGLGFLFSVLAFLLNLVYGIGMMIVVLVLGYAFLFAFVAPLMVLVGEVPAAELTAAGWALLIVGSVLANALFVWILVRIVRAIRASHGAKSDGPQPSEAESS